LSIGCEYIKRARAHYLPPRRKLHNYILQHQEKMEMSLKWVYTRLTLGLN
jgi:hypothetical protein